LATTPSTSTRGPICTGQQRARGVQPPKRSLGRRWPMQDHDTVRSVWMGLRLLRVPGLVHDELVGSCWITAGSEGRGKAEFGKRTSVHCQVFLWLARRKARSSSEINSFSTCQTPHASWVSTAAVIMHDNLQGPRRKRMRRAWGHASHACQTRPGPVVAPAMKEASPAFHLTAVQPTAESAALAWQLTELFPLT
jgi:hypothetical protein